MRNGAISAARWFNQQVADGRTWDVVFCSSMLDLATWRGLLQTESPPVVYYFHENQLTYPNRGDAQRDLHFAFTNWTSVLAADAVWFNTAFHQRDWQQAIQTLLARMPNSDATSDPTLSVETCDRSDEIADKSCVHSPGIRPLQPAARSTGEPLSIVWAARWEHDKRPDRLLKLVQNIESAGLRFRLSVLGQSFDVVPPALAELQQTYEEWLDQYGTASTDRYRETLSKADVFVSTADHEFFGISAVEAMSGGCFPLLPNRLAYPELVGEAGDGFLYESDDDLAEKVRVLIERKRVQGSVWADGQQSFSEAMQRFSWEARAAEMDDHLEELVRTDG